MSNGQQRMTKYAFSVEPDGKVRSAVMVPGTIVEEIAAGVYSLVATPGEGVYLRPENGFKLPERIYGNAVANADRFLRSYELNDKNLGVLLVGDTGSGKTLTLKALAAKAVQLGYLVILINTAFPDEVLNHFMTEIKQPTVVCFDEYDKIYSERDSDGDSRSGDQRGMLQLLDGTTVADKKLYVLTANHEDLISPYMKNRPSRIRYTIRFKRLDLDTVVDFVQTNLKNFTEAHLRAFVHMALSEGDSSDGMNFDSMRELVTEMNQFNCSLTDALNIMATRGASASPIFEVTAFINGKAAHRTVVTASVPCPYVENGNWSINTTLPFPSAKDPKVLERVVFTLTSGDFVAFGPTHDLLEFEQGDMQFHLRYVDNSSSQIIAARIEKEFIAKAKEDGLTMSGQQFARPASSGTSRAEFLNAAFASHLSSKHYDATS